MCFPIELSVLLSLANENPNGLSWKHLSITIGRRIIAG